MQTEHDVINISPLGGAVYSFQQQKCPDSPLALAEVPRLASGTNFCYFVDYFIFYLFEKVYLR